MTQIIGLEGILGMKKNMQKEEGQEMTSEYFLLATLSAVRQAGRTVKAHLTGSQVPGLIVE